MAIEIKSKQRDDSYNCRNTKKLINTNIGPILDFVVISQLVKNNNVIVHDYW